MPCLQWVVVRPDSLVDGDVSKYVVHEALVASKFKPGHRRLANVAHLMCELATDDDLATLGRPGAVIVDD